MRDAVKTNRCRKDEEQLGTPFLLGQDEQDREKDIEVLLYCERPEVAGIEGVCRLKVAEKAGVVADEKERGEDLRQLNREVDGSFEDQKCARKTAAAGRMRKARRT